MGKGKGKGKGRKKRFGDRSDGRRLRTLDPYNAMTPFIMKARNDSTNYMTHTVEVSAADRFLRRKRLEGYPGMGVLHLFIAAYIRTASQFPAINRFVSGQRIYSRDNIEYVMTIKKEMKTSAPETSVKVIFDLRDTITDVYRKLQLEIEKVKNEGVDTRTDDLAAMFMKLPRLILKSTVRFLEILDYFGMLPKSLLKASPFHGSMIITDLGSIGLPPNFHHLYNFGNLPLFIAFGSRRKARELRADGTFVERKYVDFMFSMDERCCDGFYFSQAFKLFKLVLSNPQMLDEPPETVVEDVD